MVGCRWREGLLANIFSRVKELIPEALRGGSVGRPIPETQIPEYAAVCRNALGLMRPNLLPAEIRFLDELTEYFQNCIGHENAILTEDSETEHGYWRWRREFWREWDKVFHDVIQARKIITDNPVGWIWVWQEDLLVLRLFSDLEQMQGALRKRPQELYLRESWALDLEVRLPKLIKQEGLDGKVAVPKPPARR